MACGFTWIAGVMISALPLTPWASGWRFYSQTGICIPLPVNNQWNSKDLSKRLHTQAVQQYDFSSSNNFDGQRFAFGIMVILNFVLFVLIALGQIGIYLSVRRSSMKGSKSKHESSFMCRQKSSELKLAYRLATVVVSDFLCWFPIGVLGLMAAYEHPVPSEVNVAIVIFVLPLNAALNPFLYTLNIVLEKRQEKQMTRLTALIERKLKQEMKLKEKH